jgi:hypothetical protein
MTGWETRNVMQVHLNADRFKLKKNKATLCSALLPVTRRYLLINQTFNRMVNSVNSPSFESA